jgi:hypothetical protein
MALALTEPSRLIVRLLKAALLMFILLPCLAQTNAGRSNPPDCLQAGGAVEPSISSTPPTCDRDRLRVSEDAAVRATEKLFHLSSAEIVFIGCETASDFSTDVVRTSSSSHFVIVYPMSVSKSSDYVAPMLHELGHVYQLKRVGDKEQLLQMLERTELGADFLAGLAARKVGLNPGVFEISLRLVGSYRSSPRVSHGRPEDRSSAFRYGYNEPAGPLDSQYDDFQDNLFSQLKHD